MSDTGPGEPTIRAPESHEPSGRGLRIVRELSTAFGIRAVPGSPGKTVWFVVDLAEQATRNPAPG